MAENQPDDDPPALQMLKNTKMRIDLMVYDENNVYQGFINYRIRAGQKWGDIFSHYAQTTNTNLENLLFESNDMVGNYGILNYNNPIHKDFPRGVILDLDRDVYNIRVRRLPPQPHISKKRKLDQKRRTTKTNRSKRGKRTTKMNRSKRGKRTTKMNRSKQRKRQRY